jgi:hypothetical protein
MADSDQILQLGIEEARNGNREAARNLFELLTRQEPDNSQAWLWLAGVADGTDQRREALQHVIALDPSNEMARKGLQALGVDPNSVPAAVPETVIPSPGPERSRSADEAFADELDLAFDDDYAAVPRAETPRRDPDLEDGEGSGVSPTASRRSTADRPTLRRANPRVQVSDDDDDDDEPVRSGPSSLLWILLGGLVVLLLGWWLWGFINPQPQVAEPTAVTVGQPTVAPGEPTVAPGEPTVAPGEPTVAPGEPTAAPGTEATPAPGTEATPVPGGPDPAVGANPAPAAIGATLESNGWSYSYPNANYVVLLGQNAGGQTAQGTFVHVLAWIANGTGTNQPMPADFFVLKDAQGRVYNALPQVSSALVQRGVNADIGLEDAVPANGVTTSVYLVFDVQPGATDLTLFARNNPGQGWKLNLNVP